MAKERRCRSEGGKDKSKINICKHNRPQKKRGKNNRRNEPKIMSTMEDVVTFHYIWLVCVLSSFLIFSFFLILFFVVTAVVQLACSLAIFFFIFCLIFHQLSCKTKLNRRTDNGWWAMLIIWQAMTAPWLMGICLLQVSHWGRSE